MAIKMPSKYEILINNQKGANQGQGTVARRVRQTSMSSNTPKPRIRGIDRRLVGNIALKGMGIYFSRIGDLTGNRIYQKNANTAIRWLGLGALAYTNPAVATVTAVATVASNVFGYQVDTFRSRAEKEIYRHISGNTETSGSRYGGRKR